MKDEALKLALEALRMADELCRGHGVDFKEYGLEFDRDIQVKYKDAITAIKEALTQPAQEPLKYSFKAYLTEDNRIGVVACVVRPDGGVHLLEEIIDMPKEKKT